MPKIIYSKIGVFNSIYILYNYREYFAIYFTIIQIYSRYNVYISLYNYSTCCTNRVPTRSVYQVHDYAFGTPTTRLRVQCTYKALTNQGDASVYRPRSLHQYRRQSPSKRAYNTIRVFRAPGYDSLRAIELIRTLIITKIL